LQTKATHLAVIGVVAALAAVLVVELAPSLVKTLATAHAKVVVDVVVLVHIAAPPLATAVAEVAMSIDNERTISEKNQERLAIRRGKEYYIHRHKGLSTGLQILLSCWQK